MGSIKLKGETLFEKFKEYSDLILDGGFILDSENEKEVKSAIEKFEKNKEGVMLIGNPGGGKTLFFDILQKILNPTDKNFFIKLNVLDVVLQFNNKEVAHSVFRKWSDKNALFDDLGTEDKGHNFGEKVEVFEKFIQFRYELFRHKGIKTYFTSNLSYEDIKLRYGIRCASRLNEMCNVISIGGSSKSSDRRKLRNFKGFLQVVHDIPIDPEILAVKEKYRIMKENPSPPSDYKGLGSRIKNQIG